MAWKRFGGMIAELRSARGWNGAELGRVINSSQSRVSKIENGKLAVSPSELEQLLKALRVSEDEANQLRFAYGLTDVPALNLRAVIAGGVDNRQHQIRKYEEVAVRRQEYANALMPGLLQTERYARAVMVSLGLDADAADNAVHARIARQRILRDPRRSFEFLISEAVLYTMPGDESTQVEQLNDLILLIQRIRHLQIGIVPFERGTAVKAFNGYVIFDSQAVTTETVVVEQEFTDPHDVRSYLELHLELYARAVFAKDAVDRILRASRYFERNLEPGTPP